jgi:hypothetical protein
VKLRAKSAGKDIVFGHEDRGRQRDGSWLSVYTWEDGRRTFINCPAKIVDKARDQVAARFEYVTMRLRRKGIVLSDFEEVVE